MAVPTATAALTAAIARGDERAFGAFYDAWFDACFVLARATSRRDEAFCLDVVQDVMLKVVRAMRPLASEAAVQAWMTATVGSAVVDRLRSEQRRQRRERRAAADVNAAAIAEEPALVLIAGERRAWLQQQIAELPAPEQALLAARFGDEWTVQSVATSFGMSADAAHGRLRRALLRLRRAAAKWWGQ